MLYICDAERAEYNSIWNLRGGIFSYTQWVKLMLEVDGVTQNAGHTGLDFLLFSPLAEQEKSY